MTTLKNAIIAIAASAVFATAASAQDARITLETEMAGQSLSTETVDMVAYYLDMGEMLELTVTYIEKTDPEDPNRFQMQLLDGDAVTFALPGIEGTKYAFARTGDVITIDALPVFAPIRAAQIRH